MNGQLPVALYNSRVLVDSGIKELENMLCNAIGAPHCVVTGSGQTALEFALSAAGVGIGDRVFCTTLGYGSIVRVIKRLGAEPVFVDINPNTFNLDAFCLEFMIGRCARGKEKVPKALIALDLFGLPCDYPRIEAICEKHGISLIEDMTQAFGGMVKSKKCGSFGRFAVGSILDEGSLGENGIVFCHSAKDMQRLRELRDAWHWRGAGEMGICAECAQIILLSERFGTLTEEFVRRNEAAQKYSENFEGKVKTQWLEDGYISAYSRYVLALPSSEVRAAVMDSLMKHHIPCSIYYPVPLHQQIDDSAWRNITLTNAERTAQKLLAIPLHPYISPGIIDRVSRIVIDTVLEQGGNAVNDTAV